MYSPFSRDAAAAEDRIDDEFADDAAHKDRRHADRRYADRNERSLAGSTFILLVLGTLLAGSFGAIQRHRQRRSIGRAKPLPERLQTWEGEGGRPDPEPVAESLPEASSSAPAF